MSQHSTLPRLGPACGIVFPVALFVASGHHAYPVGLVAILLFAPFAAGLIGITVKILSVVPELARNQATKGTELYAALDHMAGMATVFSLWPLALMLAIVALLTLRDRALPRPLGYFAAATAVALAVNGSFLHAESVPALLLFLLWTLITSITLLRKTRRAPRNATQTAAATA